VPAGSFEARVRLNHGIPVVELRGQLDVFAEDALTAAHAEAVAGNPAALVLNFDHAGYINSTGIGLIVGLLAESRAANRRLLACGLTDHYQGIFRITRLAEFIPMFPDEASALAEVGPPAADARQKGA